MKHFEISYFVGNVAFTYQCTTIHEAIRAFDALAHRDPHVYDSTRLDDMIETLVSMKKGITLKSSGAYFSIRYVDGEV